MKIISPKTIKTNVRKYGFVEATEKAESVIDKSLYTLMRNVLSKAKSFAEKDNMRYIGIEHIEKAFGSSKRLKQRGGAETTMPLEYFGVRTNHYVNDPQGLDMTVSDSFIRPPHMVNDPSMIIQEPVSFLKNTDIAVNGFDTDRSLSFGMVSQQNGGSMVENTFKVPKSMISQQCREHDLKVRPDAMRFMKEKIENTFHGLMSKVSKVAKGDNILHDNYIENILGQRKYKLLKE